MFTSERERFWIKKENTLIPNGYNIHPGGEGGCTKESAAKGVATKKSHGYHHSEETRRKMSIVAKGRQKSEEHKKHLSENHKTKCKKTIVFENGEELETDEPLYVIAKKYNIVSPNTLARKSAKGLFLNNIRIKEYYGKTYKL